MKNRRWRTAPALFETSKKNHKHNTLKKLTMKGILS